MSEDQGTYSVKFAGFPQPEQNYSKLPHVFVDNLPTIDTVSELKVVLYTLRHTWGFSEFDKPKKITTDEFMNGRKRRDGSRMDNGTGLSNKSIIDGLERAVSHGFLIVTVDDSDKARIEKFYALNMSNSDVESLHTGKESLHSDCVDSTHRSEKETTETNLTRRTLPKEEGKDLVDGYLDLAQAPGIKRMARIDAILSYLGGKLRINTETKRWKDFAKFVDDRQQSYNESLETFIRWLVGQKNFDVQFWPPSKMQEMWPQAFMIDEYAYTERSHAL